jgi:hypothetical protein
LRIIINPFSEKYSLPANYFFHASKVAKSKKTGESLFSENNNTIKIPANDIAMICTKEKLTLDLNHSGICLPCLEYAIDGLGGVHIGGKNEGCKHTIKFIITGEYQPNPFQAIKKTLRPVSRVLLSSFPRSISNKTFPAASGTFLPSGTSFLFPAERLSVMGGRGLPANA